MRRAATTAPARSPWAKAHHGAESARPEPAKGQRRPRSPKTPPTGVVRPEPDRSRRPATQRRRSPARGATTRTHFEAGEPTTRAVRRRPTASQAGATAATDGRKTQAVRGKPKVLRNAFHQDPVVAWLVVVGGPGLGAFRPIYEGNNASAAASPAHPHRLRRRHHLLGGAGLHPLRFDGPLVPVRAQPLQDQRRRHQRQEADRRGEAGAHGRDHAWAAPSSAFVPFCGEDFDWSELSELKE